MVTVRTKNPGIFEYYGITSPESASSGRTHTLEQISLISIRVNREISCFHLAIDRLAGPEPFVDLSISHTVFFLFFVYVYKVALSPG